MLTGFSLERILGVPIYLRDLFLANRGPSAHRSCRRAPCAVHDVARARSRPYCRVSSRCGRSRVGAATLKAGRGACTDGAVRSSRMAATLLEVGTLLGRRALLTLHNRCLLDRHSMATARSSAFDRGDTPQIVERSLLLATLLDRLRHCSIGRS